MHIEVYSSDSEFLGYVHSISKTTHKVKLTKYKFNAKTYKNDNSAIADSNIVSAYYRNTVLTRLVN